MFKRIFRKRRLKKDRSCIPTGLIPLRDIHSAAAVIDAAEAGWDSCVEKVKAFCKASGISLTVLFIDMRKPGKKAGNLPDRQLTITRRDINWFGRPRLKKAALVTGKPVDLFLCLVDDDSYCIEYLSKSAKAMFKVGRRPFDGDPFDLIVAESLPGIQTASNEEEDPGADTRKREPSGKIAEEIFGKIAEIITKIG